MSQFRSVYDVPLDISVTYGDSEHGKIHINQEPFDFFSKKMPIPEKKCSWTKWDDKNIPFLFDSEQDEVITYSEGAAVINYDIVAGCFFFLSGWQEFYCEKLDAIGRFPYSESIQYQLGIPHVPVVNYYFDILKTAIEKVYNVSISLRTEPSVFLTHDIDKINSGWKEDGFHEIKKGKIFSGIKILSKRFNETDDWFNFDRMMELEAKYNQKSMLYFLPQQGMNNGVLNSDYDVTSPSIQKTIAAILQKDWKVGIHGSYGTSTDVDFLKQEVEKIGVPIDSNRFHYLSWNPKLTPTVIDESNIAVDSTLGFAEHYGFRNGIATPFNLYNLEKDNPCSFLEYPLNLMDTTFQQRKYLTVPKEDIPAIAEQLLAETTKFGGCFTVLWHNNFFSDYKYEGWEEIYEKILMMIAKTTIR